MNRAREEVRKGLGLNTFYLLGHSWGSFLAIGYASKYQNHLKALVLCNADIYETGANQSYQGILIATLLKKYLSIQNMRIPLGWDKLNNYTNPELNRKIMAKAMPVFIKEHYCRLDTLPDPVLRSKIHAEAARNKYNRYLTRDMNRVDYEPYLKKITVPTLFIGSQYDYMNPADYDKMKNAIGSKYAKVYVCPNGAHFDMWDDTANFFRELNRFIKDVDKMGKE